MRASPRRPQRCPSLAGRTACLVSTVLVSLALSIVTGPTNAADAQLSTTNTTEPQLQLLDQDNWIGPRGTFHMVLHVVAPNQDYTLQARLFPAVSTSEDVLAAAITPLKVRPLDRFANFAVPAGRTTQRLEFAVVAEADGTFGDPYVLEPGVYPVEVRLFDPDGELMASLVTHLVHLPQSLLLDPVSVAVIADLRLAPQRSSAGRALLSAQSAAQLQRQLDGLSRFSDIPLSVQLHPETVSGLVDNRTGVGGPALSSIIRMAGPTGVAEILGGTFVGFNEANWLTDLHRETFRREIEAGAAVLDTTQLRHRRNTAALSGPTDALVLASLAEIGVDRVVSNEAGNTKTMVGLGLGPSPLLERPSQSLLPVPAFDLAAFTPTTMMTPGILDAHRVLAALVLPAIDGDKRSQQLRFGTTLDFGGEFVSTVLSALATNGPLQSVTLNSLFENHLAYGPPVSAPSNSASFGASNPRSDHLATVTARINGLRTLLGDPQLADALEAQLMLFPAEDISEGDAAALLNNVEATIRSVTNAVVLPQSQAFTTTAHETAIPLVLRNTSNRPLAVLLTLVSGEVEFTGPNPLPVTLKPGPNDLEFHIKTRRSGDFDFAIHVSTLDQAITLGDIPVRVQSRAISGVGLFLSISALVFLIIWWFRNARRGSKTNGTKSRSDTSGSSDNVPVDRTISHPGYAAGHSKLNDPSPPLSKPIHT